MNKLELFEAVLHTGNKTIEQLREEYKDVTDAEVLAYQKIYACLDGEKAIVAPSFSKPDEYAFLGLFDSVKQKECSYLMEQDPFMGSYIADRETFDSDYADEGYAPSGIFNLQKDQVEIAGLVGRVEG